MKRFAIFIGIDSYTNDITPLRCACNDANDLALKFAAAGFDKIELVKEKDAESAKLISKVKNFCKEMKDSDLLVFYFAGHGRELNGEHYLVGKDGFADPNLYTMGSLPMSAIVNVTNKEGVRRLFILDCCRDNLLAGRSTSYACGESRSIALNSAVSAQSGFIPPLILNSCSSGEKAFEDNVSGHGQFTKALLQTISDSRINSFAAFRKQLNNNMSAIVNQNICWNGNVDAWEDVKLFASWNPDPVPEPPVVPHVIPESFYDVKWRASQCQSRLERKKIPIPEKLRRLLWIASTAEKQGDYTTAVKQLQHFVELAGNESAPTPADPRADVKSLEEIALKNGVKLEMVYVEPGSFTMSKRDGENRDDEIEHVKTLTTAFYMSKYLVTNSLWWTVTGRQPPSKKNSADNYPVESVSWFDALKFCKQLNEWCKETLAGKWRFMLPTEAQWEFAARGGNRSKGCKYSGSNNLDRVGYYLANSGSTTNTVGSLQVNELGIFDMTGNVWEWCLDNYKEDSRECPAEFSRSYFEKSSAERVLRGGSWNYGAGFCRVAVRSGRTPDCCRSYIGFRLVLVPVK